MRDLFLVVGRLFPANPAIDAAVTRARIDAPPGEAWRRLMFYEEVPQRPPLLLKLFLPSPVRTQGGAKEPGATVECTYSRGGLAKRITVAEAPRLLRFEVLEQRLGIEHCITTVEGSYEIRAEGDGCEVALTTRYRGVLRPRWLWRAVERFLAHQLHRHILRGMGAKREGFR
ncbi:MAG TPA: SRPBCC family protein [Usitatibacteraceae bacterium]|nr:SRPBCC family protein [Usitatibacteraceae bacterium]